MGNVVKSPKVGFGGFEVTVPSFLAKTFGMTGDSKNSKDQAFFVDEECYLGKNGDLDECADFDPKP